MKPNIERLQKLLDFLKELKSNQFDYTLYVANTNEKGNCGTVCCAAGWIPEVFKEESPFTWEEVIEEIILTRVDFLDESSITEMFSEKEQDIINYYNRLDLNTIDVKLMAFFDFSYEQIYALFHGSEYDQIAIKLPVTSLRSSLPEVINLFQSFINKYQNDKA